jgi:aminomethyltransferase|tara:strand:+ start:90490 stop:91659 length:1170 start_codon:yes stop_codon:yes gene_type:complete
LNNLKQTPLTDEHLKLKAKMVPFSGWNMPVQYTNIMDEHNTVRTKAGLFDTCHMGEFNVKGANAKKFLQMMLVNDIEMLIPGKSQYSMMCYENGGIIDDLFVYMINEEEYMLVVNADTTDKDFEWLTKHKFKEVELENLSRKTGKIDLQGPLSEKILQNICNHNISTLNRFRFVDAAVDGKKVIISRTGYTGEDGFEIYSDSDDTVNIWNLILENGKEEKIKPIGLGARDTLRLEACYNLHGHETNEKISPVEASSGWAVRVHKTNFFGKEILIEQKKNGTKKINAAFEMIDKAIARDHYEVQKNNQEIGIVTSGTFSPTFKKSIGLAFIQKEFSSPGTEIDILIRGKAHKAKIIKKPFYPYKGKHIDIKEDQKWKIQKNLSTLKSMNG